MATSHSLRATKDIDLVLIIEAVDAAFGKRIHVSEVTVLDVPYLIPFKARAWIDLSRRKAEGEHIDSKTIRKHKNDVFRLTELLDPNMEPLPYLPDAIKTDMNKFTECMRLEKLDLKQIGIQDKSKESILEELKVIYGGEQI